MNRFVPKVIHVNEKKNLLHYRSHHLAVCFSCKNIFPTIIFFSQINAFFLPAQSLDYSAFIHTKVLSPIFQRRKSILYFFRVKGLSSFFNNVKLQFSFRYLRMVCQNMFALLHLHSLIIFGTPCSQTVQNCLMV